MRTPRPEPAPSPIKLGLLDFCNIGTDGSAERGLADTIESAVLADRLGYKRYWLAEHWVADVSTPSPELLTPIMAGITDRIRVGPAGVLLPFYSPLKVVSNALLTERLFPGRTDLGLARGGASAQVVRALAGNVETKTLAASYPDKVEEVASYLQGRAPVPSCARLGSPPEVWVLGSGGGSAPLAAQIGASFALSLFHPGAAADPGIVGDQYRTRFRPSGIPPHRPHACIAVTGVCAQTDAAAQRIALAHTNSFVRADIIGTLERWRHDLGVLCRRFGVDEVGVLELSRDPDDHRVGIEALGDVFALDALTNA
jgi:luciferase family oxidoreductase group 1